jgi:hypothetical protein
MAEKYYRLRVYPIKAELARFKTRTSDPAFGTFFRVLTDMTDMTYVILGGRRLSYVLIEAMPWFSLEAVLNCVRFLMTFLGLTEFPPESSLSDTICVIPHI